MGCACGGFWQPTPTLPHSPAVSDSLSGCLSLNRFPALSLVPNVCITACWQYPMSSPPPAHPIGYCTCLPLLLCSIASRPPLALAASFLDSTLSTWVTRLSPQGGRGWGRTGPRAPLAHLACSCNERNAISRNPPRWARWWHEWPFLGRGPSGRRPIGGPRGGGGGGAEGGNRRGIIFDCLAARGRFSACVRPLLGSGRARIVLCRARGGCLA